MRRAFTLVLLALAALALTAAPALAEGYNNGGWNYTTGASQAGYAANAGIYVRTPEGAAQEKAWRGPHGGYTTTTNKCQDCHSTHYATGSYMLLRANSRETACDFCHTGGGGSTTNIMMDQPVSGAGSYADAGATDSIVNAGSIATLERGMGTGHTLGYKGASPAGINPAWADTEGFSCFDCHTPHGNSARVLATPANPGAAIDIFSAAVGATAPYNGVVEQVFLNHGGLEPSATVLNELRINAPGSPIDGMYDLNRASQARWAEICASGLTPPTKTARWGVSPFARNMVFRRGALHPYVAGVADVNAITRPIFEQGKWLLLKNPQASSAVETMTVYDWAISGTGTPNPIAGANPAPLLNPLRGRVRTLYPGDPIPDTVVGFRFDRTTGHVAENVDSAVWNGNQAGLPGALKTINSTAAPVRNKDKVYLKGAFTVAQIDANGPAVQAAWVDMADDGVNKYAIDWDNFLGPADSASKDEQESDRVQAYPFTPSPTKPGFGSVNEFCADCHDGTAGASTQAANVYSDPVQSDATAGTYQVVYSHDAQPRH